MKTYKDWLMHFGILGMRWGKLNGPPYPLSRSQMNSRERRYDDLSSVLESPRPETVSTTSYSKSYEPKPDRYPTIDLGKYLDGLVGSNMSVEDISARLFHKRDEEAVSFVSKMLKSIYGG